MVTPHLKYVEGIVSQVIGRALHEEFELQTGRDRPTCGAIRTKNGQGKVVAEVSTDGGWTILQAQWGVAGDIPGRILRRAVELATLEGRRDVTTDGVIELMRRSYECSANKKFSAGPQKKILGDAYTRKCRKPRR